MDFLAFNKTVIDEFRSAKGSVGGMMEGRPLVLVNMVGAKTGRDLVSPLVYSTDGEDIVVIASAAGAPKHPNWYHNLVANPEVTIEVGDETWEAKAELAQGSERRRLYDAQAAEMPQFVEYEELATAAGRQIPVFKLRKR